MFWIRIRIQELKKRSKILNNHNIILLFSDFYNILSFNWLLLMRKSYNCNYNNQIYTFQPYYDETDIPTQNCNKKTIQVVFRMKMYKNFIIIICSSTVIFYLLKLNSHHPFKLHLQLSAPLWMRTALSLQGQRNESCWILSFMNWTVTTKAPDYLDKMVLQIILFSS